MYKRNKFDIEGMHCPSCSHRLQKHLTNLPGVKEASVNLAAGSLSIEYDSDKVSLSAIEEEIQNMGYKPILLKPTANLKHFYGRRIKRNELKLRLASKRMTFVFIFFLPLLIIGLLSSFPTNNLQTYILSNHIPEYTLFQFFMTIPIIIIGWNIIQDGWFKLLKLHPNINSLVAISVTFSIIYSLYSSYYLIWDNFISPKYPLYFVQASAILTMILLGRYLEGRISTKTEQSLRKLASLLPEKTILLKNKEEYLINIEEIQTDDLIKITPQMHIPADGIVMNGSSIIDDSIFSGSKSSTQIIEGEKVLAGTLNVTETIIIKVIKKSADSFLANIIGVIEEGENSKPSISNIADKAASIVIPLIISVAVLAGTIWAIFTNNYPFSFNIFISVLIIACPVAIGLAIPVSVLISTRRASSLGIIIRRISAFESILKANTYVFNMNGTLTKGIPNITDIINTSNISSLDLLKYSASAEALSNHPIAEAITQEAKNKKIQTTTPDPVRELPGLGIEAVVEDLRIDIGNRKLMELIQVDTEELQRLSNICRELSEQGKTTVMIAIDGILKGVIAAMDEPRKEACEIIAYLKKEGKHVILLTGEHWSTARYIAHEIGIKDIHAEIQPINRARFIRKLQYEGKKVIMVGDGYNDAGALAQANAGIVIGSPNDITADVADIVLLNKDLSLLIVAKRLALKTVRNMKENLFFAFLYNSLMIPVATGLLYLFNIKFLLDPIVAITVMFLGSLSVLLNGLRLRRFRYLLNQ